MSEDTGLALFVYKRPEHTRQVLEGLRENSIDSMYVFSDGPASASERGAVERVRSVVADVSWCDVELVESGENKGLARSLVDGFDHVLDRHERIVMLEDDCVPAPDFMDYMTACLDRYQDLDRVMNVHGYSPPIAVPEGYPYDVYFTHRTGSWGQGTWRDAWGRLETDPQAFVDLLETSEGRERLRRAGRDLEGMLEAQLSGSIDSIGIWWALTLVKHEGLSVNPVRPRVKNIGHDGTGTHTVETERFDVALRNGHAGGEMELPAEPFVDDALNERFNRFMGRGSTVDRLKRLLADIVRSDDPVATLRQRLSF